MSLSHLQHVPCGYCGRVEALSTSTAEPAANKAHTVATATGDTRAGGIWRANRRLAP
eukprot:CAMPEP_0198501280 /NCGR_PEP_ID=MMETSP1462-20131121/8627_1 /TAXON_ID=1333877 /ORGANISM="Brandtodinium nutriculum, Strain RCC3387" /LENGTH=56 /DNA_ID=CAMNT_0044230317 /DNA_START=426 /DNA_END=593 /DNA_ORIENTATION=+